MRRPPTIPGRFQPIQSHTARPMTKLAITPARHEGGAAAGRERWLGSAGAIPLLEPDRLTCRVQSKDLPTGLVVGHSGTVIVAQAAEAVGLGGDDRGRCERTDARLAPDKR